MLSWQSRARILSFLNGDIDFDRDFVGVVSVDSLISDGAEFLAGVRINAEGPTEIPLTDLRISIISDKPDPNADPIAVTAGDLTAVLTDSLLLEWFWQKQRIRQLALAAVCCVLDAHRNLCEDFLSIETVEPENVAICVDIEVEPEADIELVLARVYHEIEKYLNPPIPYFTIDELLDEGLCPDDIFNGPYVDFDFECGGERVFTKPGFVKDADLAASELRDVVYASDIINLLMDIEGVLAVRNLLLRKYDGAGNAIGSNEKWCLPITPNRQPVLYIEKSKVVFFKNGLPYRAKATETEQTLEHLRAMARKAAYVDPDQTLEPPVGEHRDPGDFYSVQHDFPKTYGIGRAGLPRTADDERRAQARQFKAYLTFFDQILADYLAQLANVRRLFSLDKTLEQTYFSRFLASPDITAVDHALTFEDEFYVDKTALQSLLDKGRLSENEEIFFDRRNRLLDHLISRFAERFTDYVLMMFDLDGDPLKTGERLIDDKIDFLSEYPACQPRAGQSLQLPPGGSRRRLGYRQHCRTEAPCEPSAGHFGYPTTRSRVRGARPGSVQHASSRRQAPRRDQNCRKRRALPVEAVVQSPEAGAESGQESLSGNPSGVVL